MKKLLMQSDDYGITDAVSDGVIKGITKGIIRNTGMFVNMDSSKLAAEKIKSVDVCLGIDINFVAGKPVSNPKEIPSLVDADGMFITSKEQMKKYPLKEVQGLVAVFEEDPYPYDEVLLETENQVKRFIELMGRNPEYLHPHSLCTPNTMKAMKKIADKYDIVFSMDVLSDDKYNYPTDVDLLDKNRSLEDQLKPDKKVEFINKFLPNIGDNEIWIYIVHCGHIDYELFKHTSLTLDRMLDLDLAVDKEVIKYIKENEIELITYRDLV